MLREDLVLGLAYLGAQSLFLAAIRAEYFSASLRVVEVGCEVEGRMCEPIVGEVLSRVNHWAV